jgi:beta-fructofuranosidase
MKRREFVAAASIGVSSLAGGFAFGQGDGRQRTEPFPDDPHRPRYHFLPPKNWMNDPNGLLLHRGMFHLFYQHNPGAAVWGDMHWGHAVSQDLITWRNLPIALAPTPGGYDKDGVFSGCAVVNGAEPTILYTGTQPEVQALATSGDPLLERWQKHEGNPVIAAPPEGMDVTGFRDPCVWREGADWMMALGSGVKGKGGCVLLYRSPDLRQWEYLHPLAESSDLALGTMWECPSFFPLGDRHVLLISPIPLRKALWAVGRYADRRFVPERWGSLDDGGHFYAPQTFLDGANRRVMFGWSWEGRSREAQVKAGWAGAQSLPRVLSLREDGGLRQEPHPYCQRLTRFGKSVKGLPIGDELQAELRSAAIEGNAGRLDVILEPGEAEEVGIGFYRSPDDAEETRVVFRVKEGLVKVDRSRSSLSPDQEQKEFTAPLRLAKGEVLNATLFLDRSLVEIYVNESCCLTTRVYPSRADSLGIQFFGGGKKTLLREATWRTIRHRTS